MKIHEVIGETFTAGAVATTIPSVANDVQRVVQRPKKPKKIGGKKKPGPKTKTATLLAKS
jgi:hypothetical protein